MKFRLSTLLLACALAIVLIGWLVERSRWGNERSRLLAENDRLASIRDDSIRPLTDGCEAMFKAVYAAELFYQAKKSDELTQRLEQELIASVVAVWRQRENIDLFWSKHDLESNPPIELVTAAAPLMALEFKSGSEFINAAQHLTQFSESPASYPELFDSNSEIYDLFTQFLETAIDVADGG